MPTTGGGRVTGNEHFIAAEKLLGQLPTIESGSPQEVGTLAEAQVHATLALVWAFNRAQTEAYGLLQAMLDREAEQRGDSEWTRAERARGAIQ